MSILVIDISTNTHISTCETTAELANPLPSGLKTITTIIPFNPSNQIWDSKLGEVIPIMKPILVEKLTLSSATDREILNAIAIRLGIGI